VNGRALRELADWDWNQFKEAGLSVLMGDLESHGARYLVAVLLRENTLERAVCDASLFTLAQATAITKIATTIDTQFDIYLARRLTSSAKIDELEAVRILKILEEASNGVRLQPFLSQLLTHTNHHIRSKAALLIGRSNRNPEWAGEQMSDADARVRANAVEALWGIDDPACVAFFKEAAHDPHQRVAGNAMVGLYKLHDATSIRMLFEIAARPGVGWQTTAAWAMGETGNPRFHSILTRLMSTGESKLRQNAIRALSRIRQFRKSSQNAGKFLVSLGWETAGAGSPMKVFASVASEGKGHVPNLPPLDFLLLEGREVVQDYTVVEFRAPPVLALGFAVPQLPRFAESGLEAYLEQKRRADHWCIQWYAIEPRRRSAFSGGNQGILRLEGPSEEPVVAARIQFTSDAGGLAKSIKGWDSGDVLPEGLAASIKSLLEDLLYMSASRHLICMSAESSFPMTETDVQAIVARARTGRVVIHAIAAKGDPNEAFFQTMSRETAGGFHSISGPDEIPAVLNRIQMSMVDRYELTFQQKNLEAGDITLWICSRLGYGEATTPIASHALCEVYGS